MPRFALQKRKAGNYVASSSSPERHTNASAYPTCLLRTHSKVLQSRFSKSRRTRTRTQTHMKKHTHVYTHTPTHTHTQMFKHKQNTLTHTHTHMQEHEHAHTHMPTRTNVQTQSNNTHTQTDTNMGTPCKPPLLIPIYPLRIKAFHHAGHGGEYWGSTQQDSSLSRQTIILPCPLARHGVRLTALLV